DLRIDAKNPRTKQRELPSGKISLKEAWLFVVVSLGVFVLSARMLNPLCFKLSPVAIGFFVLYPYTKRFTYLSHFVLGVTISGAPLGAWIAIRGSFDWQIIPLCVGVVFWLAGFDTLYALQDYEFDRKEGLYSIPAKVGIKGALQLAKLFHLVTFLMLVFTGWVFGLGPAYFLGTLIAGGLLYYEHSLVREDDLSKLDMAFFNMNGYLSLTVFFFTLLDILLR
ncbi:MAG: 4-hydroxybenzoate octaprenyltransferase, partial [Nitrospirae bacterium]